MDYITDAVRLTRTWRRTFSFPFRSLSVPLPFPFRYAGKMKGPFRESVPWIMEKWLASARRHSLTFRDSFPSVPLPFCKWF